MPTPSLTIIIPTLQEQQHLPLLLDDLHAQRDLRAEIIVSDGGSTDHTRQLATSRGATVITSDKPGRARQLNAALKLARSEYIAILHADTRITQPDALSRALTALVCAQAQTPQRPTFGHGVLMFCGELPRRHPAASRALALKSALNRPGTTHGDQGLFASRDALTRLGPFDERLPFLEDLMMATTIEAKGRWITLPICLQTSSRRFDTEGFSARYATMGVFMAAKAIGLEALFEPSLYPPQHQARRMAPHTIIARAVALINQHPAPQRRAMWLRLGTYLRQNLWQLPLWLDALEGAQPDPHHAATPPRLAAFERHIEPRLAHANYLDPMLAILAAAALQSHARWPR